MEIDNIIEQIKQGKVGVIPTDTIYGLVTSVFFKESIERIYRVKERNSTKPLIVLISSLRDLATFDVDINDELLNKLNKIWPNPVSVIIPVKTNKFEYIDRGTHTIAFRMPNDFKLLNLISKTGPIVAPSANKESMPPAENIDQAKKYFHDDIDFYLDGGSLSAPPSTLIEIKDGKVNILRNGSIDIEKLF